MRNLRLAIVHNTVAPYRHPLFEFLSKRLDLTVYYCLLKERFREWDLWPRKYSYRYLVLSRVPVGGASLNPSIIGRLMSDRPDVVVIGGYTDPTMWLAYAAVRFLGIPLIYWTEGTKEPKSILGIATRRLRAFFIKKSSSIVVPGRLSRNYAFSLGASEEEVFIAPNAIDNDFFIQLSGEYGPLKEEFKSQFGLRGKVVILCVSQFVERKGIEYLLHAYKMLRKEKNGMALLLIGSGPLESKLRRIASLLGLKDIKFIHSNLTSSELIKFYTCADVLVQPTLEDVWGFVINEAMACGLPVVATRTSQAAVEMIHDGRSGFITKEGNIPELCEALSKLVADSRLRVRMGKKARETVINEFNVANMCSGFMKAIDHSAKNSR